MTVPSYDFSGQVVVVTGGAAVGAALVTSFGAVGAQTIAGASFGVVPDHQPDLARLVVEDTTSRHGRLDVVVITTDPSTDDAVGPGSAQTEAIVGGLLIDPFVWAQAAHRVMVDQVGGGTIIVVGPPPGSEPASPASSLAADAAWAGVINLTSTLALEWAPSTRVICVSVGEQVDDQDVAQACLFLASQAAVAFSGSNVVLNGRPSLASVPASPDEPAGA